MTNNFCNSSLFLRYLAIFSVIAMFASPGITRATHLPNGLMGLQTIPAVILDDGRTSFKIEIDANGPVNRVTVNCVSVYLVAPTTPPFDLRDDGQGGDRVAGDHIFTSGYFRYNTAQALPLSMALDGTGVLGVFRIQFPGTQFDSKTPTGIPCVAVEKPDGSVSSVASSLTVGVLRSDKLTVTPTTIQSVRVTEHVINSQTDIPVAAVSLENVSADLSKLTLPVYQSLQDNFDFLVVFPTINVMKPNGGSVGVYHQVSRKHTGDGPGKLIDNTARYGSDGRLLGIAALRAYDGISTSNALHELLHHWASYTDVSLGINVVGNHYPSRTNIDSLLGSPRWAANSDGTFTIDCGPFFHAGKLDKYMMGLIDGSQVPPIYIYRDTLPTPANKCLFLNDPIIYPADIVKTVTIQDIQALHGVRTPATATAQRDFSLGFVVESNRILNPVEMTYYELIAAHFTKILPDSVPDPIIGSYWVPMTRFFGEGTTWRSDAITPRDKPWLRITTPAQNETVSGIVNIVAEATDNQNVSAVGFLTCNATLTDTNRPYTFLWDTRTAPDGPCTIFAQVWDSLGNTSTRQAQVQILNLPQVSITSPQNNTYVSGSVPVSAEASDNRGITKVDFYLCSGQAVSDTSYPYSVSWDTTSNNNGACFLTATAYDTDGNIKNTDVTVVYVNNTLPALVGGSSLPER